MLVALQVISTCLLWLLGPLGQAQTNTFALYLSVDLLAFAVISYQYRMSKNGKSPGEVWLASGYLLLVVLLVANLTLL